MVRRSIAGLWTCGLLAGLGMAQVAAKDLVLAEIHPPGHVIVQSEEVLHSKLAELTKGELQVQVKHSGQAGNEAQAWDKVKAGTLDIARVNLAMLAKDMPAVKLVSLPYLFRSREHMWRVLEGEFGKRIQSEAEKVGAVVLTYYDSGTRSFYSTKQPIRSLADFNGLRVRVQDSPVYKDLILQLGGTPVVLPYDKVGEAFQKGEIDAAENNVPSYVSSGHYKLAKHYSFDEHSAVPEVLVVSRKTWQGLSVAQQQALSSAAASSSAQMKTLWADSELQSLAKAKKEGAVITDKSRMSMSGIEGFAVKLYSKYITDRDELETVLSILRTK
ncbi:TRAP transporter substrate-binding protein DctP [Uliginosibacterium aquaticum]|nr:TRAP transporter substrate-binding protein DctP [Uliginosibacterium aquaticum]